MSICVRACAFLSLYPYLFLFLSLSVYIYIYIYMSRNERGTISSLNGQPLKLVDYFIYLGSNISSMESDINIYIGKAGTAIDRLSIM